MLRGVALCDEACVAQLVEGALLEPDREGAQRVRGLLGCQCGKGRGVDSAGEEDADGDIGDEVRAHRVAQAGS